MCTVSTQAYLYRIIYIPDIALLCIDGVCCVSLSPSLVAGISWLETVSTVSQYCSSCLCPLTHEPHQRGRRLFLLSCIDWELKLGEPDLSVEVRTWSVRKVFGWSDRSVAKAKPERKFTWRYDRLNLSPTRERRITHRCED